MDKSPLKKYLIEILQQITIEKEKYRDYYSMDKFWVVRLDGEKLFEIKIDE